MGLLISVRVAFSVSREESFGLLAAHWKSLDELGSIRFASKLKVFAISLEKSYRFMRVAPAK